MRILTISNLPANPTQGSGQVILGYVRGLKGLGHHVDLVEPDEYEIFQRLRPRANSYRQALGIFWLCQRMKNLETYDVIEFYGGEAWLATQQLARRPGRRYLLVQHTNGPEPRCEALLDQAYGKGRRKWYQLDQSQLMKGAFAGADLVVTVSCYDREWLIDKGWQPPTRVVAIENPISDVFFTDSAKPAKEQIIGYCGTWLAKKGIQVLTQDLTHILREFPDWRMMLIGVGKAFDVHQHFQADVTSRIMVFPHISDKRELKALYDRISIFAFPSVIESFGLALAEAMACGCACATSAVGLGSSLVHETEALVLPKPRSPLLYNAVRGLIQNPELRKRLSENGKRRVQHLRWPMAIRRLEQAYKSALGTEMGGVSGHR